MFSEDDTDGDADETFRDGDPIAILPPRAREALRQLRLAQSDAAALSQSLSDEIAKIREEKHDIERKTHAVATTYGSKFTAEDQERADAVIGRLKGEMDRLRDALELRARRTGALTELLRQVERFLTEASFSSAEFTDATIALPKLGKNENLADAIEDKRRRLRELNADRRKVQAAPLPSSVVKQKLRAEINQLAEHGAPSLSPAVEAGEPIGFQREFGFVSLPDGEVGRFSIPNTLGLVAWLHRDRLLEALDREVDAIADDQHSLTDEQRKSKLDEIASDHLATEFEEEVLVREAERVGQSVLRRSDQSPQSVLMVREAK